MTPVTWTVRPSAGREGKVRVVVIFAVIAGLFGWALTRKWIFAPIGTGLVLAATAEFWLGVRFVLDEKGASRRVGLSSTVIAWSDVKRIVHQGPDIVLSPLEKEGRSDAFRGVRLVVPSEHETTVKRAIDEGLRSVAGKG